MKIIDDFIYTDDAGNRLTNVNDASQNYSGYPSSSGTLIDYDDNGNMTSQKDKGINSISYNYLDLPSSVIYNTSYIVQDPFGGQIERNVNTQYLYDAGGTKLKTEYTAFHSKSQLEIKRITEYLDNFQYENGALQFTANEEGYYDFVQNRYIYTYKDHLGNIRLSYYKQTDSTAKVLEENNYYPFGLRHTGYYPLTESTYRYKYNGKEVQENGMYDYGARMYMPEIARWGVMDPMAEQYRAWSTYNYAVNNPISFIDPDGRMTYDWKLGAYRDNGGNIMNWDDAVNALHGYAFGSANDSYDSRSGGSDIVSFISALGDSGGGDNPMLSLVGTITDWLTKAKIDPNGKPGTGVASIMKFMKKVPQLKFLYEASGSFEMIVDLLKDKPVTVPDGIESNFGTITFGASSFKSNLQLGIDIIHETWHAWDIKNLTHSKIFKFAEKIDFNNRREINTNIMELRAYDFELRYAPKNINAEGVKRYLEYFEVLRTYFYPSDPNQFIYKW